MKNPFRYFKSAKFYATRAFNKCKKMTGSQDYFIRLIEAFIFIIEADEMDRPQWFDTQIKQDCWSAVMRYHFKNEFAGHSSDEFLKEFKQRFNDYKWWKDYWDNFDNKHNSNTSNMNTANMNLLTTLNCLNTTIIAGIH